MYNLLQRTALHFLGTIIMAVGLVQELNIALISQRGWPFHSQQSARETNESPIPILKSPRNGAFFNSFPQGRMGTYQIMCGQGHWS